MKSFKFSLIYGVLVWLIPFAIAILIYPIRTSDRPFFESIMPVVVTICTVFFANLYFKKVESNFLKEGILLGIIWLAISLIIDLIMFSSGPRKMGIIEYLKDIGFTYLIIPAITIGIGFLLGMFCRSGAQRSRHFFSCVKSYS